MSATLTSSTPDWTPLPFDPTKMLEENVGDRFEETNLLFTDPRSGVPDIPTEVDQFIKLAQIGWGAQVGAGKRLGYWATVALIQNILTVHIGLGVPRKGQLNP